MKGRKTLKEIFISERKGKRKEIKNFLFQFQNKEKKNEKASSLYCKRYFD